MFLKSSGRITRMYGQQNSTNVFYSCEWEEPKNMTDTGLQTITHFDTYNMIIFNWTFDKNNTITSKLTDFGITRRIVYHNISCAVFKDEMWWQRPGKKQKGKKSEKRERRYAREKCSIQTGFRSHDDKRTCAR
ncbi:uncharacterized protein LOC119373643 isoform X2 [Rhipicephalus sanguineus]|uniref:uncharacterized protein LOC119373643 isoform X2 n=1 Tax=Rhipicephalus sanguineus TaxID=34632 RepID=UPI001893B3EB|nr:uncharacterized protein LOC119373643 isoform X2 [Rhipicephalus sanguineus]